MPFSTTRRPAAALALLLACSCTNDYDALIGAGGSAGVGAASTAEVASSASSSAVASSSSATTAGSTATGGGDGGSGGSGGAGGGAGGEGGAGGVAVLPGAPPCEGVTLDFTFALEALPPPWTQSTAGSVELETGGGLFTATFDGNGRDRGGLAAPVAGWTGCSVAVPLPEAPDLTDLDPVRVAAYVGATSSAGPIPSLVAMWSLEEVGVPVTTVVGAIRLPTSPGALEWTVGPLERRAVRGLRLRQSGVSLFYDVSADGVAWEPIAELIASPEGVTVGAWKDSILQSDESVQVTLGPVNP